ncbi:MAG: hypothetical protein JWM74_2702 [Myxococcaceae bacterium]|nr:hypothetical protein [Myxococcaceae bacterium]
MHDAYARGRFDDAIGIAQDVLRERPGDTACLGTIDDCRRSLEELHGFSTAARYRVPVLARSMSEIAAMALDHRAGFLLSLIQGGGRCTVEDILTMCPMSEHEALEVLFGLVRVGAVKLE